MRPNYLVFVTMDGTVNANGRDRNPQEEILLCALYDLGQSHKQLMIRAAWFHELHPMMGGHNGNKISAQRKGNSESNPNRGAEGRDERPIVVQEKEDRIPDSDDRDRDGGPNATQLWRRRQGRN